MLEEYFDRPETVDRIRASWIGEDVERYVVWLDGQGYSCRSVLRRVPLVLAFGEFARGRGAVGVEDLAGHVEAFVAERVARYPCARRCGESVQPVAVAALAPHAQALVVEVEVREVGAEHLLGAGGGFIQQPPQALLAERDVVAAKQPLQRRRRDRLGAVGRLVAAFQHAGGIRGQPAPASRERGERAQRGDVAVPCPARSRPMRLR